MKSRRFNGYLRFVDNAVRESGEVFSIKATPAQSLLGLQLWDLSAKDVPGPYVSILGKGWAVNNQKQECPARTLFYARSGETVSLLLRAGERFENLQFRVYGEITMPQEETAAIDVTTVDQ